MKILSINACHYLRGGSEIVYFNTSRLLEERGHQVAYFSTMDQRNEKTPFDKYFISVGNIRDLSLAGKILKAPSYLYNYEAERKLEKLISDFRPDVAHVHIFYGVLSVSVLRVLKKHGIPVVHTVHDYRLLCPVNTLIDNQGKVCELCKDRHFTHCIRKKCSEGIFNQSLMVAMEAYFWKYFINPVNLIDHFIFVSNFSKRKHLEFNECFSGRFTRLYNFTHFNSSSDSHPGKGDYFLYFGRLSVEKGINTLISAFSGNKSHSLKIAGTGPLKEFVENAAGQNANISYLGFRKGKDLEELIKNASFIMMPSECYENNPLSVVEAYSLGKPVIGSRIAGIPELIKEGENGFLFEPGNRESLMAAIEASVDIKGSVYQSFSRSVYDFGRFNFDIDQHYSGLIKIFTDVINKKKS